MTSILADSGGVDWSIPGRVATLALVVLTTTSLALGYAAAIPADVVRSQDEANVTDDARKIVVVSSPGTDEPVNHTFEVTGALEE